MGLYLRGGYRILAIVFILSVLPFRVYSMEAINIITWWGYFSSELIRPIEKKCHVTISYDEFYSNPELFRRMKKEEYDIAIYGDSVYQYFSRLYPEQYANISDDIIVNYHPAVKQLYQGLGLPKNTVFFQLSLAGLLWNPLTIYLDAQDTLESIVNKSKRKTIVLMDEHVEVLSFLSGIDTTHLKRPLGYDKIKTIEIIELFEESDVIISNNLGSIIQKSDFSFAFTWSGEALKKIIEGNLHHEFLAHPSLSHWSSTILELISNKKGAQCVARALASERSINRVIEKSYSLSPYGMRGDNNMRHPYGRVSEYFFSHIDQLEKLRSEPYHIYQIYDKEWQKLKLLINSSRK